MCVNFSQILLKNDLARSVRRENKEEKAKFSIAISEKIDFENFLQKIVESCRKNIRQIGQFFVTLI